MGEVENVRKLRDKAVHNINRGMFLQNPAVLSELWLACEITNFVAKNLFQRGD